MNYFCFVRSFCCLFFLKPLPKFILFTYQRLLAGKQNKTKQHLPKLKLNFKSIDWSNMKIKLISKLRISQGLSNNSQISIDPPIVNTTLTGSRATLVRKANRICKYTMHVTVTVAIWLIVAHSMGGPSEICWLKLILSQSLKVHKKQVFVI